jgi:acetyltransferase-like isoleucine patch superfamily enzyme
MALFHRRDRVRFQDPLNWVPRVLKKLYSMWVGWTYPFPSKGRKLSIHYTCILERTTAHRMKLGNYVSFLKDAVVYVLNVSSPEEKGEPIIIIDDHCTIAQRCQIGAKNLIHIERDVILSASALIVDHLHAYEDVTLPIAQQGVTEGGRIRIGQGCWIGHAAAIICDKGELILGRNCVVAANAVVTRSFPPYSVIAGNPARVVKQFDPVKGVWVLGASRREPPDAGKQEPVTTDSVQS